MKPHPVEKWVHIAGASLLGALVTAHLSEQVSPSLFDVGLVLVGLGAFGINAVFSERVDIGGTWYTITRSVMAVIGWISVCWLFLIVTGCQPVKIEPPPPVVIRTDSSGERLTEFQLESPAGLKVRLKESEGITVSK